MFQSGTSGHIGLDQAGIEALVVFMESHRSVPVTYQLDVLLLLQGGSGPVWPVALASTSAGD